MRYLRYIYTAISVTGSVVILWGVVLGTIGFIRFGLYSPRCNEVHDWIMRVRQLLGYYILLGLEFLIAADVIRTVINPTPSDVAMLGAIVVIRILLSYFLNREISSDRASSSKK